MITCSQKNNAEKPGKVIAVFSTSGGVGKTTIAVNMAAAVSNMPGQRVCIIDADLQFGDVCRFLNIVPHMTIADFAGRGFNRGQQPSEFITPWRDGVDVLSAPIKPEQADTVTPEVFDAVVRNLRAFYTCIIVDTAVGFSDVVIAAADCADTVLVVGALDSIPTVKNLKTGLDTLKNLGYEDNKIKTVLNRDKARTFMSVREVEVLLGCKFSSLLANDFNTAVDALHTYQPFVIGRPNSELAKQMVTLAKDLLSE